MCFTSSELFVESFFFMMFHCVCVVLFALVDVEESLGFGEYAFCRAQKQLEVLHCFDVSFGLADQFAGRAATPCA